MFTGIIERTAKVLGVAKGPAFLRLTLADHWGDVTAGESIAVNGVCLTVAERAAGELGFDVVPETLSKTNLGLLAQRDSVHVERAACRRSHLRPLRARARRWNSNADRTRRRRRRRLSRDVTTPDELADYLTPKGSVTLDGVSLTIAGVSGNQFQVALIPTTLQITLLGQRPVGWPFNLETDVLTKSVVTWLRNHRA